MNRFEESEKAAAAREAREAVGSSQRPTSGRGDEVRAALMHYLATEHFHERKGPPPATEDDERQDPDEPS